jgi:PucR family transcriptional regulator, purine catabolism regulatory protein
MANSDASSRQLVRQIAVFDALRDSTALSDLPALFRRLEHVSGFELYLCSPAGLPLLPGVPGIPDDRRDLLGRPGDAPAHVPGGYIVSVPVDGKNAGYLLGLRTASAEPGGLGTLQHIATIAALQRATLERERESTAAKARNCWPSYWPGARPVSWPAGSMRCSARPQSSASP